MLQLVLPFLVLVAGSVSIQAAGDDAALFKRWVEEMKTTARGPFQRIRWFCNDGETLPPEPYACVPHGGGIQHDEWNEKTLTIRAAGYPIANVLGEYAHDVGSIVSIGTCCPRSLPN